MGYINSNIARELGRKEHSNWRDKFWSRRHRAILILSEEDLVERLRYLLANGTKEHLVTKPQRWPGAHCAQALCSGTTDRGVWIDRTELRRHRQTRFVDPERLRQPQDGPGALPAKMRAKRFPELKTPSRRRGASATADCVSESEVSRWYSVKLSILPQWEKLSPADQQAQVRSLCHHISRTAAEERQRSGAVVFGLKRLMRYSPHHKPDRISKSPAPQVHAREPSLKRWFQRSYRVFLASYMDAHRAMVLSLEHYAFPEGGHAPTRLSIE